MSTPERLGASFDQAVELYARTRPRYPSAIFDALADTTCLAPGTGQATQDLAARGCLIVAVERGARLAKRARRELTGLPKVELVTASFEEWPLPIKPFDLVFAATSFEWLAPDLRVTKAAAALRRGAGDPGDPSCGGRQRGVL